MKRFSTLNFIAILAVLVFAFSSCEKEGPRGPAGPKGETGEGVPGPKGDKGDTGGFTFQEFTFDKVTIPAGIGSSTNLNFNVTKADFEKSLVMLYFSAGTERNNWLVMPGIGSGGQHIYRVWYAFPDNANLTSRAIVQRTAGPEDQAQTYTSARIIVIPLETVSAMQAAGINMDDTKAVQTALKLQ